MKSPFLSYATALLLTLAASLGLPASVLAQAEVDSDEVFRRGDSIEYVDGIQGNGLRAEITREHADSEKFFITVLYREGDGRLEPFKRDWLESKELRSFAVPEKPSQSWAHMRFYNVDDPTQKVRWEGIRVVSTPTILIQPCISGTWGDPSTVIFQTVYRGQPKELASRMAYALQLYASKLKERPRPLNRDAGERAPRHVIGDAEGLQPAPAKYATGHYAQATTIDDETNVSVPWRHQSLRQVEIPPFPKYVPSQDSPYDANPYDAGQCPPNRPCPLPQPERDPDVDRRPWGPLRPNTPNQPFVLPEIPPERRPWFNPVSWLAYIVGGILATLLGLVCSTVAIVLIVFAMIWGIKALYRLAFPKEPAKVDPPAQQVVHVMQPAYQQPGPAPVAAQVMPQPQYQQPVYQPPYQPAPQQHVVPPYTPPAYTPPTA